MPSESPLPPELTKQLTSISLNWDLPKIDPMPPPLPKSPTGSPTAGTEAQSSRPPSPDMTSSPDMPPLTRTSTKCVVTWDLPRTTEKNEAKPVPLSTRRINRSTPTPPPDGELRLIKGYPVTPAPKSVENRPLGSSEFSIKGRGRSSSKAPLSTDDTGSVRDFLLSMATSPPKEVSSCNRKSVSFAEPQLADSASPVLERPPSSPPLTLSSLSERPWWAHDLPNTGIRSPRSRKRGSKSPPGLPQPPPPLSPASPSLQIINQPTPKPYRGQELSIIADLHRDHLPHVNHSNCHGSLHIFSVPTKEEFKDHKIVVTLKAGSSVPKGARILAFKFRIMTLGLYKAVVRLNLVHLGDTVTEEEIETNEFEVVDRISATGEGPQSIAFPPGFGR
ncbi:hypothetical protein MMC31_008090, partial [Peltigera leucophlebia]|nr:hypothetical protein [Peltigera leucophlebia]